MADQPRLIEVAGWLALVRHGQSTWIVENRFQGQSDSPLSPLGERQAELVGLRLRDPAKTPALPLPATAPIRIWHSPLARAASTAAAIRRARGGDAPLHPDARLSELAQGRWEGLTHAEVTERYGSELAAWRADPVHNHAPGGESLPEGAARVGAALDDITAALRNASSTAAAANSDPVLGYGAGADGTAWGIVVAHDGILRLALLTLLGVPLDLYWSFPFALGAVSVVEILGGRARLRAHNLAEHLDELAAGDAGPSTDRGGAL